VYNGIDRLDNDLGYVPGNVVSACGRCNKAKLTMPVGDVLAWVKAVYENLGLDELDEGKRRVRRHLESAVTGGRGA